MRKFIKYKRWNTPNGFEFCFQSRHGAISFRCPLSIQYYEFISGHKFIWTWQSPIAIDIYDDPFFDLFH